MKTASKLQEKYSCGHTIRVRISDLYECLVNAHYECFNRSCPDVSKIKPYLKTSLASYLKKANFSENEQAYYLSEYWMNNIIELEFLMYHHHKVGKPCQRHVRLWITIQDGLFVDIREDDWDALVVASETGRVAFPSSKVKELGHAVLYGCA